MSKRLGIVTVLFATACGNIDPEQASTSTGDPVVLDSTFEARFGADHPSLLGRIVLSPTHVVDFYEAGDRVVAYAEIGRDVKPTAILAGDVGRMTPVQVFQSLAREQPVPPKLRKYERFFPAGLVASEQPLQDPANAEIERRQQAAFINTTDRWSSWSGGNCPYSTHFETVQGPLGPFCPKLSNTYPVRECWDHINWGFIERSSVKESLGTVCIDQGTGIQVYRVAINSGHPTAGRTYGFNPRAGDWIQFKVVAGCSGVSCATPRVKFDLSPVSNGHGHLGWGYKHW